MTDLNWWMWVCNQTMAGYQNPPLFCEENFQNYDHTEGCGWVRRKNPWPEGITAQRPPGGRT